MKTNEAKTTKTDAERFHYLDRVMGVMTGSASGDALGAGYEFCGKPPKRGYARMLPGTLQRGAPGNWTDDTAMALCILQAKSDPQRTAERFLRWFRSNPPDIGNATRSVLGHAESAAMLPACSRAYGEWAEARKPAGWDPGGANGSLMRTGPACLPYLGNREKIAQAARELSDLTHYSPDGYTAEACILWSLAIDRAIELGPDFTPGRIMDGLEFTDPEHRETWTKIIQTALHGPSPKGKFNGSAVGAFVASLYAVAHGHGLVDTLQLVVSFGSDTDTTGAITGQLAGAMYGDLEVPREWKRLIHGYPGLRCNDLQRLALEAAGSPSDLETE